jgi:predicted Zn-dependent peptidase
MFLRKTLSNGIRVIAQPLMHFKSVSIGVWIKTGSACETDEENGISHFIEHMVFKGTEKRSAKQIAADMDKIGGQINAFTSKECTCFHAKVMSEKIDIAVDVLSDIVSHSVFDPAEMDKEKGVVIEEINMSNDNPEDLAHEMMSVTYFTGNPLSKTILGTAENIKKFCRNDIIKYMNTHYFPENMVISVAGNFEENALFDLLEKHFSGYMNDHMERPSEICAEALHAEKRFMAIKREIEQIHICLAMPGYAYEDKKRYPLSVLNNVLGGSMSSRLFQKIREEKGMAYSVFSYPSVYTKSGMFSVYAGTSAAYAEEVTTLIIKELQKLKDEGVPEEEYLQSKEQLRGNYILSIESTSSIMNNIGKSLLLLNEVKSDDEVIAELDSVTLKDTNDVMHEVFTLDKLTSVYVGNVQDEEKFKALV